MALTSTLSLFSCADNDYYREYDYIEKPDTTSVDYKLVWSDEFDDPSNRLLNTANWSYETGGDGWGNNELQYYLNTGFLGKDTVALVKNGFLNINAYKVKLEGNNYISARVNTTKSWLYGKFEARIKLPAGKGLWPAFWMMPKDFQAWPLDGEIDIMEHVSKEPTNVYTSIHTQAYNHKDKTEKTAVYQVADAESEFHIYSLEWTDKKIVGRVDGISFFVFENDGKGDKNTWPFNKPFYLKLNMAVGGDWGGEIDDSKLPATYEIDWVRVYQK